MAVIVKSDSVRAKIAAEDHGYVTPAEVDEAALFCEGRGARWDDDPERGRRLIIRGTTAAGRSLLVVLYPMNENDEDEGTWRLATAYVV